MSPSVVFVNFGLIGSGQMPGARDVTQGAGHPRMARCNKSSRRSGPGLNTTTGDRGISDSCKRSKNAEWKTPGGDVCTQTAANDYYSFDQIAGRYRRDLIFRSLGRILVAKAGTPVV
ncbi:MAG: hypothetical protein Q8O52_26045 [Sulfuritalea sp.]|nr:hypothetical protein [Sulfuritalea sp.]